MLNSGQRNLTVGALGTGRLLVDSLRLENASRSANSTVLVLSGVVRVASALSCPARVGHDVLFYCERVRERINRRVVDVWGFRRSQNNQIETIVDSGLMGRP